MEIPERRKNTNEYRCIEKEKLKFAKILKHVRNNQIKVKPKNVLEENVILRGDLAQISCDINVIICENAIIHPSLNDIIPPYEYRSLNIGKYTFIGKNSIISSLKIGEYVYIGENCILSDRTKVANNVKIMDNTFVPSDMELVEFGIYEGYPAKLVGYLDSQHCQFMEFLCNDYYDKLIIG